jgi:enamine deaminase RidA (YjgF/YER057c/UK114 family)
MLRSATILGLTLMAAGPAMADPPKRIGEATAAISTSVSIPATSRLVYVSGTVPDVLDPAASEGTVARYGDTYAQTKSVLAKIETALVAQGMTLGDVVMMRVFLVAAPGQSKMDFSGMMRAYSEAFGTPAQPNRPARSTMQVAGLVNPGWLAEIEVTAAK